MKPRPFLMRFELPSGGGLLDGLRARIEEEGSEALRTGLLNGLPSGRLLANPLGLSLMLPLNFRKTPKSLHQSESVGQHSEQ